RESFLDTTIIVEDNRIVFNRFQKPICSGRFFNFYSHHPLCHRRGVIICAIDRILLLFHPKFHARNLIDAVHTFLENGYPLYFIFATINNRLLFYICKYKNSHISYFPKREIAADKYFTIPYVKSVSESFKLIALKMNCKLAYSISNTLNKYIKRGRNQLDYRFITLRGTQKGVYNFFYEDCEVNYVLHEKKIKD
ncbi:hypothetical protein ALC56_07461, partial [Trachymyrmex septentrionalis]